jgi:hypothetical protein
VTGSRAAAAVISYLAILTGVLLAILPWTSFWAYNYFFNAVPALQMVLMTDVVRIGMTGLGLIDVVIGISESRALTPDSRQDPDP